MSNADPGSSLRNRAISTIPSFGTSTVISPRNSATSSTAPGKRSRRRSTAKRGGEGSMKGPSTSSPRSLVPVQRAAPPAVQEPDQKDPDEDRHLEEARQAQVPEHRRPRVQEGRLDVEQDEQHRHHVEADGVALAARLEQIDSALVGTQVGAALRPAADQGGEPQDDHRQQGGEQQLHTAR